MSDAAVRVESLLKVFDVPEREAGLFAFTRWFWQFGLRNYTGASA